MRQRECDGFRMMFSVDGYDLDYRDLAPYSRFITDSEWSEDLPAERKEIQAIQAKLQRN